MKRSRKRRLQSLKYDRYRDIRNDGEDHNGKSKDSMVPWKPVFDKNSKDELKDNVKHYSRDYNGNFEPLRIYLSNAHVEHWIKVFVFFHADTPLKQTMTRPFIMYTAFKSIDKNKSPMLDKIFANSELLKPDQSRIKLYLSRANIATEETEHTRQEDLYIDNFKLFVKENGGIDNLLKKVYDHERMLKTLYENDLEFKE